MQYISEKISNLLSSGEPKPELRWGIIGCGKISHDFAKAMRKCENPNRVSISSHDIHVHRKSRW